jgi:predicted O-methyltransferase YrrM
MRDIIQRYKLKNLCELGHFHGKSSIYLGAILEEQGFGTLTTFDILATKVTPNINTLISEFSLEKFVNPIVTTEGYTWDLSKLIEKNDTRFDFCYIDGGHTFESTLLAFILTDILLDKGGIIIFDDIDWTVEKSISAFGSAILNVPMYRSNTPHQQATPQVKMVCDLIVSKYDYTLIENKDEFNWAVFQKN